MQDSSEKPRRIPGVCALHGHSMQPTLEHGDLLEVTPGLDRPLQTGDVVLVRPTETDPPVIHRVVENTSNGIRTRGDSSTRTDPWTLEPEQVLGRITGSWTGARYRRVRSGRLGLLLARLVPLRRQVRRGLARQLGPAYRWLAGQGLLTALLPRQLQARVVTTRTSQGPDAYLVLGGRVIGRYHSLEARWQIRPPYRLLVSPALLAETGTRVTCGYPGSGSQ